MHQPQTCYQSSQVRVRGRGTEGQWGTEGLEGQWGTSYSDSDGPVHIAFTTVKQCRA